MAELPRLASIGRLLAAEGQALKAHGGERFILQAPRPGKKTLALDITPALNAGRSGLTIAGASTITLDVQDPNWDIEKSTLLDLDGDGHMGSIDLELDGVWFRLAQATRQDPNVLRLVFEDLTIALLREHRKALKASRGSTTRARFIQKMVNELPAPLRLFYSPEIDAQQPIKAPSYPTAKVTPSKSGSVGGFDKGASFKIHGDAADTAQKAEVATVMTVCDQLNVNDHVRRAAIVAAIGESGFKPIRNQGNPPSDYWGVFQGNIHVWQRTDTEGMARAFLKGGKGFQGGGAIAIDRAHPHMPAGQIAWMVEGDRSNFGSDAEATHFYQQWSDEASEIMRLWRGGSGDTSASDTVYRLKTYQFTRGLPGRREDSWEAMTRLAQEVNWRVFVAGGVVVYATDDWLISRPAELTLKDPAEGTLIEPPGYDWDHGKLAGSVTLEVIATRWSQLPGTVVVFDGPKWGPITGRWLVQDIDQNLFDETDCTVTLTKPMKPRDEPAAEVQTLAGNTKGGKGSGTGTIAYVGDSLGVGTEPYLQRIVTKTRIAANVVGGRSSADGIDALDGIFHSRRYDNVVIDLGTNDTKASQLHDSIKRARSIAPEADLYVFTVFGPYNTRAKNKMLHDWSNAHVHIVDWHAFARRENITLDSLGIHPTGAGYEKRAHLLARAMGFE